ncbi:MAG: ribosome small subunit-dependent GTPase A [Candidatus Zixiibacteriota bacterium]|nr:MAG: ribosome small subunit-dependent GTPase A [candidate division Zixibacteria bacterium]
MNLISLGWKPFFEHQFVPYKNKGFLPARVVLQHRDRCIVCCECGELTTEISGKMRHETHSRAEFPTVGDWVAINARPEEGTGIIHALLPRKSSFSRKAVLAGGPKYGEGKIEEQVLATNVDTFFLVTGLDANFNVRRIERYVSTAWDSGASPVVVLNKSDICKDVEGAVRDAEAVAFGVPIYAVSAATGEGMEALTEHLIEGNTIALLGSSGVGKSTLINRIIGEDRLDTGGVRLADSRGRHTTTHRELIQLPTGGILIDTPGLREIQMWNDDGALARTFTDIEELMTQCRFNNCQHVTEPGCAILTALENGDLDPKRYESYLKLRKEQDRLAIRKNQKERRRVEREWVKRIRQHQKIVEELRNKGLT